MYIRYQIFLFIISILVQWELSIFENEIGLVAKIDFGMMASTGYIKYKYNDDEVENFLNNDI